jgi:NADH:ubiquinone oxidoreductase subunit 3 (subunit A)
VQHLFIIVLTFSVFSFSFIYVGWLISNAHSGISRKRNHVFKQTKKGSKVQYFSYKLVYLFFDIVALSLNTFFPT